MKIFLISVLLVTSLHTKASEIVQFPYKEPQKNQDHIISKLKDLYEAHWLYNQFNQLVTTHADKINNGRFLTYKITTPAHHKNRVELLLQSFKTSADLLFLTYHSLHTDVAMLLAQENVSALEFLALYNDETQSSIPILNSVMQIMSEYDHEKKNGLSIIKSLSELYRSR
ncbi:MAG: hypothetical protein ACOYT8_00660 [Candidatus Dependentiae bacterium]